MYFLSLFVYVAYELVEAGPQTRKRGYEAISNAEIKRQSRGGYRWPQRPWINICGSCRDVIAFVRAFVALALCVVAAIAIWKGDQRQPTGICAVALHWVSLRPYRPVLSA